MNTNQPGRLLLVALGNPGDKYRTTRHNAGWLWVDYQFDVHDYVHDKYGNYDYTTFNVDGLQITILKPQTFMNNSGSAVAHAMDHFGFSLNQLLVVHDEVDLEIGNYKLQQGRGTGGHNGIDSIHKSLGTNEYWRLRLGVRPSLISPSVKADTYVLKKFSADELDKLIQINKEKILQEIS